MAYTEDVPKAAQTIAASQPIINANFQGIKTLIEVNHVTFDDADEGKHAFLQMPEQAAAPTTGASEGAVYTKDDGTKTQLYWREESNGTEYQLSGAFTTGTTDGLFTLPGGLIVKWGLRSTISGNATVTFGTPFPNNAYNVIISQVRNDSTAKVMNITPGSLSVSKFTVKSTSGGSSGLYFIAIGN